MSLRWILPQATPDVIRFTVTPTASAKTVTLENLTAPYNCFIDWGDGGKSAQLTTDTAASHAYADTTPRQITIHGVLGGFWNATTISAGKTLVTSVDEINSPSLASLAHTFRGCTALAVLPPTIDAPNVTDFSYAFYQCRSITSALPALWLCIRMRPMPRVLRIASSPCMGSMGLDVHRVSMSLLWRGRRTINIMGKVDVLLRHITRAQVKNTIMMNTEVILAVHMEIMRPIVPCAVIVEQLAITQSFPAAGWEDMCLLLHIRILAGTVIRRVYTVIK